MSYNNQKTKDQRPSPEAPIQVPRFSEENGFYTTAKRSKIMSKIRSKHTKQEVRLRLCLWHLGYRYRINDKKLPGSPDIVLKKYKLAIFVDGAFWHGYNWEEKKHKIKKNRDFWIPKIERNMQRDREQEVRLTAMGWRYLRFWEHEVKQDLSACILKIHRFLIDNPI